MGGSGEVKGVRTHIPICEVLGLKAVKVETLAPLYYGQYKA